MMVAAFLAPLVITSTFFASVYQSRKILRKLKKRSTQTSEIALESLFSEHQPDERIGKILKFGRERLGFEGAALVSAHEEKFVPLFVSGEIRGLEVGESNEAKSTYFAHTVNSSGGKTFVDYASLTEWRSSRAYKVSRWETYAGVTVRTHKGIGVLSFFSPRPRAQFLSTEDKELLKRLAAWVEVELEKREAGCAEHSRLVA